MNDSSNIVFEDLFDTLEKDRDGKKFDRGEFKICFRAALWYELVSRITAKSENYHMDMILDFHNLLYPMEANEKYVVALARTLSPDGIMRENEGFYDASRALERSLADDYEYVMYGKVYKFDENKSTQKM